MKLMYECINEVTIDCATEEEMTNIMIDMTSEETIVGMNAGKEIKSTEPIYFSFQGLIPLKEDATFDDKFHAWGTGDDRVLRRLDRDGLTISVYCMTEGYPPTHVVDYLRKNYDCEVTWFYRCDETKIAGWE